MMHLRHYSVCLVLLAASCSNNSGTSVFVSVSASSAISEVVKLHVHATAGLQTRDIDVPLAVTTIPPSHTFGIDVPDSITGMLSVHVEGFDSRGGPVGAGDGGTSLAPGQREAIPIVLLVPGVDGGVDLPPSGDLSSGGDMAGTPDLLSSGDMAQCLTGTHQCSNMCVSNFDTTTCGQTCNTPCSTSIMNAHSGCDGTNCTVTCNGGYQMCNNSICIATTDCCQPVTDCGCSAKKPLSMCGTHCNGGTYTGCYVCQQYPYAPTPPANWPFQGCKATFLDTSIMAWFFCCP